MAADYARLERNIAVYSKTFEILNQQYQLERITQKGEDGDYQIVDRAQPDPKPVAPRKSTNAAVGGVLCFMLTAALITSAKTEKTHQRDSA